MGQRRICGKIDIIMIAGLFKKVEQILARDVFEKEKNEGWGFQRAMQRDNVGMHRNGLVNGRLMGEGIAQKNFRVQKGGDITDTLPPEAVRRVLPHRDWLWKEA